MKNGKASLKFLWSLSICMPIVCVWIGDAVFWGALGKRFAIWTEPDVLFVNSVFVAAPFGVLAVRASAASRKERGSSRLGAFLIAGVAGVLTTSAVWIDHYLGAYRFQTVGPRGGIVGAACWMMLSPLLVAVVMVAAYLGVAVLFPGHSQHRDREAAGD